jgi:hypothetical protein
VRVQDVDRVVAQPLGQLGHDGELLGVLAREAHVAPSAPKRSTCRARASGLSPARRRTYTNCW